MKPLAALLPARAAASFSPSLFSPFSCLFSPCVLSGAAGPVPVELCSFCFHHTCLHGLCSASSQSENLRQATPLRVPGGPWPPCRMRHRNPSQPTNLLPTSFPAPCLSPPSTAASAPRSPVPAASLPGFEHFPACSRSHRPIVSPLAFFGFP